MRRHHGFALAAAALAAACSTHDLLDVTNPDIVQSSATNSAAGADALRAAAVGYFADSYTGTSQPGQITIAGVLSDELSASSPTDVPNIDSRNADEKISFVQQMFQYQMRARTGASLAIDGLKTYQPTSGAKIAHMYALKGLMETMIGEDWCNGIPLSDLKDGAAVLGNPLPVADVFTAAVADFDAAIAAANGTDGPKYANLARVGKGRALLNLAKYPEAAAAVAAVPDGFTFSTEHSAASAIENNGVFNWMTSTHWFTVADREGGVGLPYRSSNDPRVLWVANGKGNDNVTPFYAYAIYPAINSPARVANDVEARLIEAEAFLKAGDVTNWLAKLNTLRTRVSGLAPLTDPGTTDTRVDLMFRERAYWLFGTGHRLGDMRRLIRQYQRAANTVFPTGPYPTGGVYGDQVNFPVPFNERNNPNFTGCLDRNA